MPDTPTDEERRHFTRIPIDNGAILRCQDREWSTQLQDISLKGALLERPDDFEGEPGEQCILEILLEPQDLAIVMEGSLVHDAKGQMGFHCSYIDVDSISHLKRLIELNLGDEAALERELHELSAG